MTLYAAAVERSIVERTSTGNAATAEAEPMPPEYTDAKTLPVTRVNSHEQESKPIRQLTQVDS
jgi:hypothetical protein